MEKKGVRGKMPRSRAGIWNKGYTLIELSIIIILIGVVLLFVLPKLDNIGDAGLRASARRLAGTIQTLFDESVLKNKSYELVFNINERSYFIIERTPDQETSEIIDTTEGRTILPDRVYIKDIVIPLEGKASEGGVTIRFYPDGYVDRNIIHLSNGKKDYTLVTKPLTGKVEVLEGYVEIYEED
jgi:type II secretory pathway pseudopilin PulG